MFESFALQTENIISRKRDNLLFYLMEYPQRLSVLQTLYAEISMQLSKEIADKGDQEKIDEYHRLLKQIDSEVGRIQKMRSYKTDASKK